jgi:hypothetical protein
MSFSNILAKIILQFLHVNFYLPLNSILLYTFYTLSIKYIYYVVIK